MAAARKPFSYWNMLDVPKVSAITAPSVRNTIDRIKFMPSLPVRCINSARRVPSNLH